MKSLQCQKINEISIKGNPKQGAKNSFVIPPTENVKIYIKKNNKRKNRKLFLTNVCVFSLVIRQKTIDANNIGWLSSNCQKRTRLYHSYPAG